MGEQEDAIVFSSSCSLTLLLVILNKLTLHSTSVQKDPGTALDQGLP